MPVVPSSSVPSVAPSGTSGTPYQTAAGATPEAFGAGVGAAEQKLGGAIEQVGDVLAKHAIKMQEDVNASVAKDLFLAGDVEIGKRTVEYNSLEGINKTNEYPQYVKDVEAIREKYKGMAPNNDVARKFDQDFARRVGYSIVDGARGAATSLKAYRSEQNAAVRANSLSHIAFNAQDDKRFDDELNIGLKTYQNDDKYQGASPEEQKLLTEQYTTDAWGTRLTSMAQTDPMRARDLLKQQAEKGTITGGKYLQLETQVNQKIIEVDSRVSSDKILQSGALVPPELKEAVKRFEGYSKDKKWDYKQYSSGYGTEAQPGDENIPPDQLKAVHEQRLDNKLAQAANIVDAFAPGLPTGTRNALISLTFNAGSQWTSQGLGQSVRAGNMEEARQRFLQYNRAGGEENAGLVQRRGQEATWFGGAPVTSDPTTKLTEAMNAARERAIVVFPNDPGNQAKYLDTLQSRIRSDNSMMEQAARQMQLDMKNTVAKELINDQSIVSYDKLSPTAKQAYDLSPPSQQDVFKRQMQKNATADVPLTPERQAAYDTLYGMSKTQPDKFMGINVTELDLPRAQKSKLSAMQADRQALLQKGVKVNEAMSQLVPLLNDAQIQKSINDPVRNQEYMKFQGALEQRIDALMEKEKRPPFPKEIQEMGKDLLKETVTSKGWIWDTTEKNYRIESKPFEPPNNWQFSPSRQQYRDSEGKIYDKRGRPING